MPTPRVPAAATTFVVSLTLDELNLVRQTVMLKHSTARSNSNDRSISENDRAYYTALRDLCMAVMLKLDNSIAAQTVEGELQ